MLFRDKHIKEGVPVIRIPGGMPGKGGRAPAFWAISRVKRIMSICLMVLISYTACANPDAAGPSPDSLTNTFSLGGLVKDADGHGLENVTVLLLPVEEYAITDKEGHFSFGNLPHGNYELRLSSVGYATENRVVHLTGDTFIEVDLKERIVGLAEVAVTARSKRLGSSSVIDKSAIIHTQPLSLADVLQLVPGHLAVNPALGSAQQVNLRQIPSTTDASRAGALGTQLIIDGVPVSNNANLQNDVNILNAAPSALPPFSSVSGRGNDLRQIPVDHIESIEVIRGIPSARFGDLTSGIIIANSRIGSFKPEIRVRLNPDAMQAVFMTGFSGRDRKNIYNISSDILRARDDARNPFNQYTRLQGQLAWQYIGERDKRFVATSIISGYRTLDNLKQDPDDARYQTRHYSYDYNIKISTDGRWKAGKKWISVLQYTAALTYGHQKSYYQSLVTRDLYPLSVATTDTTMRGVYGRSEYLNQTTVDGKPLNVYIKTEATLLKNILSTRHRFIAGWEWRADVNKGNGRWFDPLYPPRQNYSMGDRPRSYRDIPALHQLAYYLEDNFSGTVAGKKLMVQAGVRIDNLAPRGCSPVNIRSLSLPALIPL